MNQGRVLSHIGINFENYLMLDIRIVSSSKSCRKEKESMILFNHLLIYINS